MNTREYQALVALQHIAQNSQNLTGLSTNSFGRDLFTISPTEALKKALGLTADAPRWRAGQTLEVARP